MARRIIFYFSESQISAAARAGGRPHRTPAVADRHLDEADEPPDAADRVRAVEPPVRDQALEGRDAPQDVEQCRDQRLLDEMTGGQGTLLLQALAHLGV